MHLVYIEISSVERENMEAEEKERQKNYSFFTVSNDIRDLPKKKPNKTTNVSSVLAVSRCCHLIHGLLSKNYNLLPQHL